MGSRTTWQRPADEANTELVSLEPVDELDTGLSGQWGPVPGVGGEPLGRRSRRPERQRSGSATNCRASPAMGTGALAVVGLAKLLPDDSVLASRLVQLPATEDL